MKKIEISFLQIVLCFLGLGTLAFLLCAPHFEGRNQGATLFEIYFHDPFLVYVYSASLLFFAGLYQAFLVLSYAKQERIFSYPALRSVRIIKYCALTLAIAITGALLLILKTAPKNDDPAGALMLGGSIAFLCIIIVAAAKFFEQILQAGITKQPKP